MENMIEAVESFESAEDPRGKFQGGYDPRSEQTYGRRWPGADAGVKTMRVYSRATFAKVRASGTFVIRRGVEKRGSRKVFLLLRLKSDSALGRGAGLSRSRRQYHNSGS